MVANQPWEMASNCKNISIELAKENRVIYVCPPLDRKVALTRPDDAYVKKVKEIVSRRADPLQVISPNLWILCPDFLAESVNWIPVPFIHDTLNRKNNRRLANCIARALATLQFSLPLVINDNVIIRAFYLKEILRPSAYIYYLRDYLISQPYYKKHGERLEKELISKSDMVVANSVFLAEYAAKYNANSHYVGQGCEIDIFDPNEELPRPHELRDIKGPVVGYIGYLTSFRLDIDLIEFIARTRPDWTIVLVGPENDVFRNSALHKMDNIIFTGNKEPDALPAYLQYFDVCINPQLLNELTIGNYPRKIDEYLAMGKPVVATRTKAMEVFQEYCLLAMNKEEYVELIQSALTNDSDDLKRARISLARSHSWSTNVADMCRTIESNLKLASSGTTGK